MTDIQMDHYRLFGSEKVTIKLFCWRKIKTKSWLTILYKLILKDLRKHYHIEIPYTVEIGGDFQWIMHTTLQLTQEQKSEKM